MNPIERFKEASALFEAGQENEAANIYVELINDPQVGAFACYRLGIIYNRQGQAGLSQRFHTRAFEMRSNLATALVSEDHPSFSYEYAPVEETDLQHCTLCGQEGTPRIVINTVTGVDFIPGFNPVRLWMYCEDCHHLFANNYPHNLGELLTNSAFDFNLQPNLSMIHVNAQILNELKKLAPGKRLLEVGVGAGELLAVAKEYQFDATGLDIRPVYANAVSNLLNIPVLTEDFQTFETEQLYDVICMGDVIEHMTDPVAALKKAHSLLNDKGVLWLSTPNFESAYIRFRKDADPMWTVVEHLQYFSYDSLKKVLIECGFEPLDYKTSAHYAGSMEVISIKK